MTLRTLALLGFVVALPVIAAAAEMHTSHGGGADTAAGAALRAANDAMMTDMDVAMTGDPDADFVRMMIPHHQSAIDMAEVLLKQEKVDPEIRAIAEDIVKAQTAEIEKFEAWLKTHDQ